MTLEEVLDRDRVWTWDSSYTVREAYVICRAGRSPEVVLRWCSDLGALEVQVPSKCFPDRASAMDGAIETAAGVLGVYQVRLEDARQIVRDISADVTRLSFVVASLRREQQADAPEPAEAA